MTEAADALSAHLLSLLLSRARDDQEGPTTADLVDVFRNGAVTSS